MKVCRIQWVDRGGPTPDTNPAVGEVWREPSVQVIRGKRVEHERTQRFPICEDHLRRADFLRSPACDYDAAWRYEAYGEGGNG